MIPLRDTNPTEGTAFVTIMLVVVNVLAFLGELFFDMQGQLELVIRDFGTVLLGNMLYLWIFGDNVEDRLGHARFLVFYLLTGLVASAAQIAINTDSTVPNIGASGAIAGVLGGYLLLYPRAQVTTLVVRFVTRVPAIIVLGFWFVYQFLNGIASLSTMDLQIGGVAFFAHIGGFVAGMLLILPVQAGLPPRGSRGWEERQRLPWG